MLYGVLPFFASLMQLMLLNILFFIFSGDELYLGNILKRREDHFEEFQLNVFTFTLC